MPQSPKNSITVAHRWPHSIRLGLAGLVLAGFINLAKADVTVCAEPGEVFSLRVSFKADDENAVIVSDSKGQRVIGFNNFFGRGAGSEWALGDGTWQAPQRSERQCFHISGYYKAGSANPALPWQTSTCRVSGKTISYNDAHVETLGGRIAKIAPPCQQTPAIRPDEKQMNTFKKAKPPTVHNRSAPVPPTATRNGARGDSRPSETSGDASSGGEQPRTTLSFNLPEFPFPPPDPSARLRIPNRSLIGNATAPSFGSVATRLEAALASNGYTELGYFAVPGGFTLVTQIERINPDATPSASQRWNIKVDPVSLKSFSLEAYVRALLQMDAGFFRVIVFVFSSEPFTASGKKVPFDQAMKWIDKGANTLPREVAAQPYGESMVCTALVYEFEIHTHGADAQLRKPSPHDGTEHLRASGILRALGE